MLVVPGLVWPVPFGENHLHATQALVDYYAPSITFRHPSMQFNVQCSLSLDNSLDGFTTSAASNGSLSHEHGHQYQSHMSVLYTFLLEHHHWVFTSIRNLFIVVLTLLQCVTLSAAFMGYQVVRQPLWIEGKVIQQGV